MGGSCNGCSILANLSTSITSGTELAMLETQLCMEREAILAIDPNMGHQGQCYK